MVVSIHTGPLQSYSTGANFVLNSIVCRLAVPFFFISSGYFLLPRGAGTSLAQQVRAAGRFSAKVAKLYGISMLIYLPLNLYAGYFSTPLWGVKLIKDILWNGTFYHLWYFPAALLGCWLALALSRLTPVAGFGIAGLLYGLGLGGDNYYGLLADLPGWGGFYQGVFTLFKYTRNGLFFAPLFMLAGLYLAKRQKPLPPLWGSIAVFGAGFALMTAEAVLLTQAGAPRHDSMYVFLPLCSVFLFMALLAIPARPRKGLRQLSMLIYIIHPWLIVFISPVARVLGLRELLVQNSLVFFVCVCVLSLAAAVVWQQLTAYFTRKNTVARARAILQVNRQALVHNLKQMQALLPGQCQVMAVVKTNAYGLGDAAVAQTLQKQGVKAFAVSTLQEGMALRRAGIRGTILVLGYTPPEQARLLQLHGLTQTLCNAAHAAALSAQKLNIKAHVKIDTGMHRLGAPAEDLEALQNIYALPHLHITGSYTHLCTADSNAPADIEYARRQIDLFFNTIAALRENGIAPGKLHVQASHGVLNYPGLPCQYARVGIALYGALSTADDYARIRPDLQPVATVKAAVASVHQLQAGQSLGYGCSYTAPGVQTIATLAIGYADGIPRNLENGYVLLHGCRAPIVGRICMDQLTVCVTGIPGVQPGDFATLLGSDGDETITAEQLAGWCGTISNEILARLGSRLGKQYV